MKLVADRKELAKSIDLALLASGRASKDVALSNILLRNDPSNQRASVESYDTHLYSKTSFAATGDPGEFAIEGTRLDHLISTAHEGPIEFDVTPDGVTARFGQASINLRTFPLDKYVRMTMNGERVTAQAVRSGLLLSALEFVRPFVGKDTQKPSQMLAELRNSRLMAGDGTRIGAVRLDTMIFPLKIPQAVMGNVTRWLKEGTAFVNSEGETQEGLIDILESDDFYLMRTTNLTSHFAWRKPEHDFMRVEPYLEELEKDVPEALIFKVDQESLQRMVDSLSVVLESGAERISFNTNGASQPTLIGVAQDSRGVESRNQVQITIPPREGADGTAPPHFSIRYSHLLDTLKLMSNPVVTCNVRTDKSILRIGESHAEMNKMALLTLLTD